MFASASTTAVAADAAGSAHAAPEALLRVENLSVGFKTDKGSLLAVDDFTYSIAPGKTLGLVGESGCGKSTIALAVMGLLPSSATIRGLRSTPT